LYDPSMAKAEEIDAAICASVGEDFPIQRD
jgi:hypothetical protein